MDGQLNKLLPPRSQTAWLSFTLNKPYCYNPIPVSWWGPEPRIQKSTPRRGTLSD